ncbi:MAG: hypothetical protein PSN44_09610 [Gammaproteobacteria bacterium]|nr:hypothetical protein [Gammaproteobacteria bacterium]
MLTSRIILVSLFIVCLSACQTVKFGDLFSGSPESEKSAPSEAPMVKETAMQPQQLLSSLSVESKQTFSIDDESRAQKALEDSYTNQPSQWQNTSSELVILPVKTFEQETGKFCREYKGTVITKAKEIGITSTACRQDNGLWVRQLK